MFLVVFGFCLYWDTVFVSGIIEDILFKNSASSMLHILVVAILYYQLLAISSNFEIGIQNENG